MLWSISAELGKKNADLEAYLAQTSAELNSLQKDKEEGLRKEKDLEQQVANLALQLSSAKAEVVADFKKSEFFEENMVLLQGPVMQIGQTKAINVCSEVFPRLNKEDPRLVELYKPNAEVEFEAQFHRFAEGADLREDEERI